MRRLLGAVTRDLPVVVKDVTSAALTGVASLAGGYDTNCAALINGQARCWGDNTTTQRNRPVIVRSATGGDGLLENPVDRKVPNAIRNVGNTGPLTLITQIDTQRYHTCARTGTGQARRWGYGEYGGLGDRDTDDDVLPRPVLI